MPTALLVAIAVFVGALILLIAVEWGAWVGMRSSRADSPAAPPAGEPLPNPGITGGPTATRAFGASPLPPPQPEGPRSPLADRLNDPARTAGDDVAAVADILTNYLETMKALPVGTTSEITAALAGDNGRAHAPLPPDHAAISPGGELLDRWGTPYFFHQVSRDFMEIRSAGGDRRLFTPDDVVWPEPASYAASSPVN